MTSPLEFTVDEGSIDLTDAFAPVLSVDTSDAVTLIDLGAELAGIALGDGVPTTDVIVIPMLGPAGPTGPTGPAGTGYDFTQASPAATWIVTHNLGFYPSVTVLVGGSEVGAEVNYVSVNQLTIKFARAQSGTAHLI